MLIIWDYYGVIAMDSFWYESKIVADGFQKSEHMYEIADKVDLGQISWDEFCVEVSKDMHLPVDTVKERFMEHRVNRAAIEAIRELKKLGHKNILLSNASHTHLVPIMKDLGIYRVFDRVFISSEIGLIKPDSRIYQFVLEQMSCLPSEAVMVDDSVRNVNAAQALGMAGVVYGAETDILSELNGITSSG
jgi:HAD superfamily hydrolase (TIGR01509 family)